MWNLLFPMRATNLLTRALELGSLMYIGGGFTTFDLIQMVQCVDQFREELRWRIC